MFLAPSPSWSYAKLFQCHDIENLIIVIEIHRNFQQNGGREERNGERYKEGKGGKEARRERNKCNIA